MLWFSKKIHLSLFILIALTTGTGFAQEPAPVISISDTSRSGNLVLWQMEGWRFSFEKPDTIIDGKNLTNTIPGSINDMRQLKNHPEWNNYGWFELEINVDSTIAGIRWVLTHGSPEPVKVWLNGRLVLQAGNPSQHPHDEKLSLFYNSVYEGVILREGINHILLEYSEHTFPGNLKPYIQSEHGIWLVLFGENGDTLRRQRAVIFGGACMLLLLLVIVHSYLAYIFRGEYHLFVSLTTLFMLFHAFTTLSDTVIDWTYSYVYFYEYSYAVSFLFVVYFFLISIRKIYSLSIPWRTLTSILIFSVMSALVSVHVYKPYMNILHPVLAVGTFAYGGFSLYQAKKKDRKATIFIISAGLIITVGGAILYVIPYVAFGVQSATLFLVAVLMAYTGIPVALTFNVAANYASLIKTLESKVQERTAELETANEYQKRFFANISHEFRTPLTITEGLINKVMRKKDLNNISTKSDLAVVKRNMNRLHDMVDQIIDLTKSEQNHLALHQDYYKADNLAAISVESFRSLAEYHGHSFHFLPEAKDAVIYVDRSKIEVIINNLISNAIKFTPDGGSIEIKTCIEADTFILTVQDSGPGIPDGKEEIIFERFHRLSRPEEEYVEGMGVGLELSQTLAKLHDGKIIAVPGTGAGALFKLTLLLVDADETELVQLLEPHEEILYQLETGKESVGKEKFSILLVEDNEDMMNYVADILSELGEIIRANNGKEALNMLSNYTPDIIITDLMMPVMGGQKLVENLLASKKWSNIPVIVLTAKALEDDKLHLLRIGVVDYITKPFLPEQLLLKTRNLLTYYNRRKKLKIDLSLEEVPITEDRLSEKAAAFIMRNLSDSNLSVDMLADEFSQSRSSFYRNIQVETGMTPAEFIREIRLTAARAMIAENKNMRLEELANAVGYKSATSFRKKYEARFGVHPLE
ncbi:MAG: response regulator [Balneolaceae bacterium]|nr:response regulator [Balneolaceae bacterium]MBO6545321.1 response regulator [Balneolaceae bacterium]MBO6646717.1 response regulator [Balneolaceae bacterium]